MLDTLIYSIEVVLMFLGLVASVFFTALFIGLLFTFIHDVFFNNKADDNGIRPEDSVYYNRELGLYQVIDNEVNNERKIYYKEIQTELDHINKIKYEEKDSK